MHHSAVAQTTKLKRNFAPAREKSTDTAAACDDNHDPGLVVSTVALPRTGNHYSTPDRDGQVRD
ncbi:hypothetical protein T4D_12349 [Trichinella pseudospiralis]|uniref:Uncharacterized protein n=1 Tax=Trichinella pseudospiralis TaxID=6337 RepID=A0A0V1G3M9_TRIPS|nr:hypothetical protein T4D_12349 [Trichinella pseudospiralis]